MYMLYSLHNNSKMARPYPLYDDLLNEVLTRTDKTVDIKRACDTIKDISRTLTEEEAYAHYYEIGALILHHEIISNGGIILSHIPYGARAMAENKGILHYMINFPPLLQQIIAQYVENSINGKYSA